MKVISLLQPWATLVVIGAKKIETRSWNTKHRGPILIHASKKIGKEQKELIHSKIFWSKLKHLEELPLGRIVGKVDIIKTAPTSYFNSFFRVKKFKELQAFTSGGVVDLNTKDEQAFGDFSSGRYGWLLKNPVAFTEHNFEIPGQLGIREFPVQICMSCGCTEFDACVHPDYGECWWALPGLCSHCAIEQGILKI